MRLTTRDINSFQKKIFIWWKAHRRDLPWRRTHDPYKILVSEVMLQQTQVTRVLPKYEEFLHVFPNVFALSKATPAMVLRIWKGMGYNRRALYLQKTAQEIVHSYEGIFPENESLLTKLPGVGIYTARAILVFAHKQNVGLVDTNIRQIITHFFFNDVPQKESTVQNVANALVPIGKSWEWHQALMDYGALELSKLRITKAKASNTNKTIPFVQSDRYFRGRIMDLLRQRPYAHDELFRYMRETYEKSEQEISRILVGLVKDGLLREKNSKFQLPE